MMDTPLHIALFLVGTLPIPLMTLFVLHADDASVLAELPKRLASFVGSLVLLGVVMLVAAKIFI